MKQKTFKTLDEQVEILKNKGLTIEDDLLAKHILLRENYFFFSGYRHLFLKSEQDRTFIPGTNFREIYGLFLFDRQLRNIIFKNILIVENNLKSILAYVISKNHGYRDNDYLNPGIYSRDGKRKRQVNDLLKKMSRQIRINGVKHTATEHYLNNYDFVPLWIGVKVLSFGIISELYTILLRDDQKEIADIKNNHIIEIHDQQTRARNMRLRLGVGIFIVISLSAFFITLLLIDRKRKQEKLKYEEVLATIRQKQMDQLAQKEVLSPDVEGYDEEPDSEPERETTSDSPFIVLQRERIVLYRSQYAASPWPQYFKAHETDIALEKKMNIAQSKEFMFYLDTLFSDIFVIMYGSNLNLNKNDFEYCAMVMLGFSTAQMSYCTQATVHSYHCRHGKMKAMLSDDWYQIVYGRKKLKKKTE